MSAKRENTDSSLNPSKRPRHRPLPVLLCPPHDTEFAEFICVCCLPAIQNTIEECRLSTISVPRQEIYFRIAVALTPPSFEGRKVILPQCIIELVTSKFPSNSLSSTFLRSSKGPRAVVVTPIRRTLSMSALELTSSLPPKTSTTENF